MLSHAGTIALINFIVKLLLLLSTNRLCGHLPNWIHIVLAASVDSLYSFLCLLQSLYFLQNPYWRIIIFFLVGWIAFGCSYASLRKCVIFFLLCMALEGISLGFGNENIWRIALASGCLCMICIYISLGDVHRKICVPVNMSFNGKNISITAMHDTGNTLRDPITGGSVLVIGADIAGELTGLTREQLRKPAETIITACLPGLRLIPYKTIGQAGGLLLALKLKDVQIGSWQGSSLVAFAPEILGKNCGYQGLTGGVL